MLQIVRLQNVYEIKKIKGLRSDTRPFFCVGRMHNSEYVHTKGHHSCVLIGNHIADCIAAASVAISE